ncbi:zinc finger BED domain-containing protein RICESLEEPER 2-like [Ipomoea triloba]|uniref:zinc finger BED domain-containing protein RICESLEEPER 2-like n=1 Tax=Ipomoea triloba TaxID=35885 RepID=UPI00125DDDF5|nr:zinc finger BED domain-containing protein RICESLEEPER 2-like [Ipomoea triloba]
MENISMPGTGSEPTNSSVHGATVVEAQTVETNAQQNVLPTTVVPQKKRKQVEVRSKVWDHFQRLSDINDVITEAKCIYCAKIYKCQTKKHGTSSLRAHILSCMKNPHSKDTRQSLLTFQAVVNSDSDEPTVGELGTWVFSQDSIRRALIEMIIIDELPFIFVEGQGFKMFIAVACPRFKIPSRWTVSRDIHVIYKEEKLKLKCLFRGNTQRVSITTDSWTSIQRINYMVVTAHFIDEEWKLHKKIISFIPVTSHKGQYIAKALETCLLEWGYIAKALETCLLEWGLRNVFTVTIDNASSNDTALGFLKRKLLSWGSSTVKCKYLHMRCIAHILNLVIQDGLKECDTVVKKVREVVRYVRNSPARLKKFRDLSDLIGIEQKSSLCLDVPTRWNSTYLMLKSAVIYQKVFEAYEESAVIYQKVFEAYEESDNSFKSDLGDSIPELHDWDSVNSLVTLLKCFYEMTIRISGSLYVTSNTTIRISGSLYVTSNTFFSEISDLFCILKSMVEADGAVKLMGANMKAKFEKYWGDIDKMNYMIFFANILDPRDKLEYMPTQINHMYGEVKGKTYLENLLTALHELFDDYAVSYRQSGSVSGFGSSSSSSSGSGSVGSFIETVQFASAPVGRPQHWLKSQIKKQRMESGGRKKTELEHYLSEAIVEEENSFDILRWWKVNSARFPILSKLARDVLAIPISTVASESAFSTSGRVLDSFRSSLTPKIVEALVCTQDWLRLPNTPLSIEENLEELERFEKEFNVEGESTSGGRTAGSSLATIPIPPDTEIRIKLEEE